MGKMILNGVPYGVTPKETINMKPYSETTLWENTNGLSVSSPTSISLVDDINNYDALCIIHAAGAETTFRSSQIIPVSNIDKTGNTNFGIFDVGANNYYYAVLTYIDDTHITLGSWGSQYSIIYYRIIGIKYGGNLSPIVYSEEEREVGVYKDNKPLYQKTLTITKTSTATLTDIGYLNIDNFVYSTGVEFDDNKTFAITLNYHENNNWYCFIEKIGDNLGIYCSNQDYNSARNVIVTIQYTKTTDTPGSGKYNTLGAPTVHYTADEQVIGTYLGKPFYQKTFDTTISIIDTSRRWYTAISSAELRAINAELVLIDSSNSYVDDSSAFYPINYSSVFGSSGGLMGGLYDKETDVVQLCIAGLLTGDKPAKITIRYTKTTD